jgi:hypothetical protein
MSFLLLRALKRQREEAAADAVERPPVGAAIPA